MRRAVVTVGTAGQAEAILVVMQASRDGYYP